MKKLYSFLKIWLAAAPLLALAVCFAPAASAQTIATGTPSFTLEQVYVNVPELNVYFYATDANGDSYTPTQVQMAEPALTLGNNELAVGSVVQASDPICYIVVLDNDSDIQPAHFRAMVRAVRSLTAALGEDDQMMLYTTAGTVTKVLDATSSTEEIYNAISSVSQAESTAEQTATANNADDTSKLTEIATTIYTDVQKEYQAIAPRKAVFFCTEIEPSDSALLGGLLTNATDELNMALYAFVAAEDPDKLDSITALAGDMLVVCKPDEMGKAMLEKQTLFATALELRTEVSESLYGETLETLTLSVPSLGSAVQSTTTVYMGHELEKPQITKAEAIARDTLRLTFNRPVDENADKTQLYIIKTEDIWGWRVRVKQVELSEDGRTATLTTEPLYAGSYSAALNNVAARNSTANVSSVRDKAAFTIESWPRDRAFYWGRFRMPLFAALVLLAALFARREYVRRREQNTEKQAEVEHILNDADGANGAEGANALPRRWVTLFWGQHGTIAESRWAGMMESSMILGSDAAQCELCLPDKRIHAQHCILSVRGEALFVQPLGERTAVYVNGERIAGEHRLQNNDTLRLGRTTVRLVL